MAKKIAKANDGVVRKLSELVNPDEFRRDYYNCSDIPNQNLIVQSFEMFRSNRGVYARIDIILIREQESAVLQTGCDPIMRALHAVDEMGGFPFAAKLVGEGNSYRFDDPVLPKDFDITGFLYNLNNPNPGYPTIQE